MLKRASTEMRLSLASCLPSRLHKVGPHKALGTAGWLVSTQPGDLEKHSGTLKPARAEMSCSLESCLAGRLPQSLASISPGRSFTKLSAKSVFNTIWQTAFQIALPNSASSCKLPWRESGVQPPKQILAL